MTSPNNTPTDTARTTSLNDVVEIYEPYHWKYNHALHDAPACPNIIEFFHPAYTSNSVVPLLRLSAPDRSTGDGTESVTLRWGLHYGLAITACSIIACNRPGYLTEGSPDGPRITSSWDGLLTSTKYYFHVKPLADEASGTIIRYPVCPTFRDWEFPTVMPQEWTSLEPPPLAENPPAALKPSIKQRNGSRCRMSGWDVQSILDRAQVIPKDEVEWFERNHMFVLKHERRLTGADALDDSRNRITLEPSLRAAWDDRKFTFVPKRGALVVHALNPHDDDTLATLYHSTKLNTPKHLSSNLYFARLAWSIFPLLLPFMMFPRLVQRRNKSGKLRLRDNVRLKWAAGYVDENDDADVECASGSNTIPPGPSEPPDEAAEMAEDLALRDRYFPDMVETVEEAETRTYHNIHWYPGQRAELRKQAKWREAIAGGNPISTVLDELHKEDV